jgi:hypothetical protein
MLRQAISSTLVNRALEKPNKNRGEWLHLVNPEVENVSFFGLGVYILHRFRPKSAPVWTASVDVLTCIADVWTAKVTFRNL